MTRPSGGGAARGKKAALPSAQELQQAIGAGSVYGFSQKESRGMFNILGQSPFSGLPTAASKGEFFETISLLNANESMRYYNPQSTKSATSRNLAGQALAPGLDSDVYYVDSQGQFVDRSIYRQSYDVDEDTGELIVPGEQGPQQGESDAPAPLSVVPTSTTNPERPRTVAAGYDKSREVITVVFRDGTFYNYYEVSPVQWQAFKARISKGQYIYQELDYHPRGPANVNSIPSYARQSLYKLTRALQLKNQGKQNYSGTKRQNTKRPKNR